MASTTRFKGAPLINGPCKVLVLSSLLGAFLLVASCDCRPNCHIVFDAGSSGTRLYIYEARGNRLVAHKGPEGDALADIVSAWNDPLWREVLIGEVISTLELIKRDGDLDEGGKPKWKAFNWERACRGVSVRFYATAGMRLKEQKPNNASRALWKDLRKALAKKTGVAEQEIDARTITGFEEGLYAWLAVRGELGTKGDDLGIVEMGGASSQITFRCETCEPSDDAVMNIRIGHDTYKMFSYSFLGLGQKQAREQVLKVKGWGLPPECVHGAGQGNGSNWTPNLCSGKIKIKDGDAVRDPLNLDPATGDKGTKKEIPAAAGNVKKWVLTGAFIHLSPKGVKDCCYEKKGEKDCFKPKYSCFRPIYLYKYLSEIEVPAYAQRSDVTWTRGAAICAENDCLPDKGELKCRWLPGAVFRLDERAAGCRGHRRGTEPAKPRSAVRGRAVPASLAFPAARALCWSAWKGQGRAPGQPGWTGRPSRTFPGPGRRAAAGSPRPRLS